MIRRVTLVFFLALCIAVQPVSARAQSEDIDDAMIDIDNDVAAFTGSWVTPAILMSDNYYGHDYRYAQCSGTALIRSEAIFDSGRIGITASTTDRYSVYVRWASELSPTSSAKYRIFDGAYTLAGGCALNQTIRSGEWIYCDTVTLTEGNTAVVKLGNDCGGGKRVVADAVRFLKLSAGPIGPAGADGKTVLSGTVDPTTEGVLGDFYINTTTSVIYGPKTAGGWGMGVSLIGPQGIQGVQGVQGPVGATGATGPQGPIGLTGPQGAVGAQGPIGPAGPQGIQGIQGDQGIQGVAGVDGKTVLSGDVDPGTEGVIGDFYINTTTSMIYGPKTARGWGSGVSLIGPQGPQGIQGVQGPVGPQGPTGPVGPQGLQGIQGSQGARGDQGIQGVAGADGRTVLSGTVNPTTQGVDGDYYINTTTSMIFGPRTGGAWGTGTSLVGPTVLTVNGSAVVNANLQNATPSAPAGGANVKWQKDTNAPANISAYLDLPALADAARRKIYLYNDFLVASNVASFTPFIGTAVSNGTINAPNAGLVTANHIGVVKARASNTNNSGYRITTDAAMILLGGGEVFECVFNITALTNGTFRFGFIDATSSADCVDGAYLEIASTGVATGKTANNSTRSSTGTTYTVSTATWYRLRIVANNNATRVDYYLYNDSGTQLWTDNLTTNIPTASGRETGVGVIGTNSQGGSADLFHLDYMAVFLNDRALIR